MNKHVKLDTHTLHTQTNMHVNSCKQMHTLCICTYTKHNTVLDMERTYLTPNITGTTNCINRATLGVVTSSSAAYTRAPATPAAPNMVIQYTVNNKSYAREKLHGFCGFSMYCENFSNECLEHGSTFNTDETK